MMENTVQVGGRTVKIIPSEDASAVQANISERDAEMDRRATAAVCAAIEKAKVCKKPICRYDSESGRAYLEYADGRKEYVD